MGLAEFALDDGTTALNLAIDRLLILNAICLVMRSSLGSNHERADLIERQLWSISD